MQQQTYRHPRCLRHLAGLWVFGFTEVSPVRCEGQRPGRLLCPCVPVPPCPCAFSQSQHGKHSTASIVGLQCPWQILLLPEPVHTVDRLQRMWPWLGSHLIQGPHTARNPIVGEWCVDYFSPRLQAAHGCVHHQVKNMYQEPITHQSNEEQNTDG